jgi:serine/threonine protein kinase
VADDKRTQLGTAPLRPVTPAPVTPAPGHATAVTDDRPDPLLGQTLASRYQIQKKLGEGGMGSVYLASHSVLEKPLAIKVLHGEFARKPDLVERFIQEAKSASRIRHENVIDISDFGSTPEGLVFFAMELLTGHDLHEEIARARLAGQLLPWERSKRIFLQVCAALIAAHALGIIHRDLKPENIYLIERLGEPDFVKLLDFGIAKQTEVADGERKLTRTGMLFGTPEYMSPEQARGETVDHRVDVYAMGCILFQLVTGKVPFEAENFMGVLSQHLTEPPPVIAVETFDAIGAPRALAQVIDKALAKDRTRRYASIDELARAVRQVSGEKPTAPVVLPVGVVAPASTTQPPANRTQTGPGRRKTAWTGTLSVPEASPPPPASGSASKLPFIVGGVIVAIGVAVTAVVVTRGGGGAGGAPVASVGNGSASAAAVVAPPPPAPQPPPTEPAAEAPLAFAWSHIKIDSQPSGAEVVDPALGKVIGHTPFVFKIKPSHTARQFELRAKSYLATVIELVPDRENVEHTEKLERGTGHKPPPSPAAPRPMAGDTGKPVTAPDAAPEIKPAPEVKPDKPAEPPAKPPAKPDDDSIELKADPSRTGSAAP